MFYNTSTPKSVPTEHEALLKLAALCSKAEHSSGEMQEKMRRWQLPAEAQARIMARLINEKYIDDARYARLFVRDKLRFDHWGPRKIEQALYRKGVAPDTIAEALADIDDADFFDILQQLLKQKRRTTKAADSYQLRSKLLRFAASRGFAIDMIYKALGSDGSDHDEWGGDY